MVSVSSKIYKIKIRCPEILLVLFIFEKRENQFWSSNYLLFSTGVCKCNKIRQKSRRLCDLNIIFNLQVNRLTEFFENKYHHFTDLINLGDCKTGLVLV